MSFYAAWFGGNGTGSGGGGGGGGVSSLNSLTGALTLAAGTGISITPSGGDTLTIASTAVAGANTALSNLSAVAINTSLLPDIDDTHDLGSATFRWDDLFVDKVRASTFVIGQSFIAQGGDAGGQVVLQAQAGISPSIGAAPGGATIGVALASQAATAPVNIFTANSASNNANATGTIYIETGNKTHASSTGDSGGLILSTGSSVGGNTGNITLKSGDAAAGNSGSITLEAGSSGVADGEILLNTSGVNLLVDAAGVAVTGGNLSVNTNSTMIQINKSSASDDSVPRIQMRTDATFGFDIMQDTNVNGDFFINRVVSGVSTNTMNIARADGTVTFEGPVIAPNLVNQSLSNLGVTAINTSLLFDADQAYNIGSATEAVDSAYINKIYGPGDTQPSIHVNNRQLITAGGNIALTWSNDTTIAVSSILRIDNNLLLENNIPLSANTVGGVSTPILKMTTADVVLFSTPDAAASSPSLPITIETGEVNGAASGIITLVTGANTGNSAADTGDIALITGISASNADNGRSGDITATTGALTSNWSTPGLPGSGDISLGTGATLNQFSGTVTIQSGPSEYQSGDVLIQSGAGLIDNDAYTGAVTLKSGDVSGGTAEPGDVNLIAGTNPDDSTLNGDLVVSAMHFRVPTTVTAGGTVGAQTINKMSGTVNFAAAASSLVVTNNLVTANSIVFAVVRTNDATALLKNVTPTAGSFTIRMNAAVTAETSVGFFVFN